MSWTQSYTGKAIYPLNFTVDMIDIEDIAHSLSNQCRYNGHCLSFYSVAQHSVLVARLLKEWGEPRQVQLTGLLHDAGEAYVSDIVRPLKKALGKVIDDIEEPIIQLIMNKFNGIYPLPDVVKRADEVLLSTEKRDLMSPEPQSWYLTQAPADWKIDPKYPDVSKDMFMAQFAKLAEGHFYRRGRL